MRTCRAPLAALGAERPRTAGGESIETRCDVASVDREFDLLLTCWCLSGLWYDPSDDRRAIASGRMILVRRLSY